MRRINHKLSRRIIFFASLVFCGSLLFAVSQPYLASYAAWWRGEERESLALETQAMHEIAEGTETTVIVIEPIEETAPLIVTETPPEPIQAVPTEDLPQMTVHSAPKLHTVQAGETLSSIAIHYYGSAKHWREIYKANKDQIPNKNKIKPGLKLIIPDVR